MQAQYVTAYIIRELGQCSRADNVACGERLDLAVGFDGCAVTTRNVQECYKMLSAVSYTGTAAEAVHKTKQSVSSSAINIIQSAACQAHHSLQL